MKPRLITLFYAAALWAFIGFLIGQWLNWRNEWVEVEEPFQMKKGVYYWFSLRPRPEIYNGPVGEFVHLDLRKGDVWVRRKDK